ncbi:hypothetical protein TNCV_3630841 [Trichonephila clavipes]|nr:hypothetical protein TNCV_3630841 [Trichonephila clavipes]
MRWCKTALSSGPIRENYTAQDKESALGFRCEMSPNKNGRHPDFRHREPIPELQLIMKILLRLQSSTMSIPCTSLSQAKLNVDLLVVK